jgi:hypothetical protein
MPQCSKKEVSTMLREWLKNIPIAQIEQILSDNRGKGTTLWVLAMHEYYRRQQCAA